MPLKLCKRKKKVGKNLQREMLLTLESACFPRYMLCTNYAYMQRARCNKRVNHNGEKSAEEVLILHYY